MADAGFRVSGHVQGVGFRWWTRSLATRLGLAGTVRNLDDGSVAVHARGQSAAVDELRRRLADGPPLSRVESVEDVPFSAAELEDGAFVAIR